MPDFLKKASKKTRSVCDDDEAPLAALFVRPLKGTETKRLGTPGGALSKVTKFADTDDTDEAGETGQTVETDQNSNGADPRVAMFARNAVLVLTTQRLLVFEHRTYSGRVGSLVGELPLSAISSMELDAPPIGESGPSSLELAFTDNLTVSLTPGSRRRKFVEAFEQTTQPA